MKIFISWSGQRSNKVANAVKSWLELFFPSVEIFMSESDIEPGTRWASRLQDELQTANYGIICLTPENQNSQWILFEAGALSNQVSSRVTPLLFQIKESEVQGPLSQFQNLRADENGFRKLATAINRNLEKPLPQIKFSEYFTTWWEQLRKTLSEISIEVQEKVADKRLDRELIEEILQYTRNQTLKEDRVIKLRRMTDSELRKMSNKEILAYIQNALERMNEGIAPSEIIQMKQKIIIAATALKEKYPDLTKVADDLIKMFPGIKI